ncbi:anti-FecI sigma factor FecR [Cellulophaga geojensis KL-A]|uniref:Anti-FecI sigma factor FecR n=1 Tax=Cellulophaga geojensis KL-A TaxID=1328323 RepID=A0ABN0RMR2_9FLAO|nr:FecR family protein [Cellulophaga geojensis]EWH13181.1 anti-FecI sigma factor FecR [Cellulophaga geojensis KL-A]
MIELVQKFIDNTISEEELITLKDWLVVPENKTLMEEYIKDDYNLNYSFLEPDTAASFVKIQQQINNNKPAKRIWPVVFKYAAVIILLVGFVYGIYMSGFLNIDNKLENQITLELPDGTIKPINVGKKVFFKINESNTQVKQEYTKLVYDQKEDENKKLVYNKLVVPYGERFQIQLSDGTIVFLNAGSSLRYPVAFNKPNNRKVYLQGEAYFDVAKNKKKPFFVETEKVNVTVLGTKFNVSTYANENNNSVVLQEGSVRVISNNVVDNDSLTIVPGERVKLVNNKFIAEKVNVNKHIAWIDGSLLFINDEFKNIILELERHYNVKINNTNDALNNIRYTASFKKGETLESILELFTENTNFEFKIENKVVTLK